VGSVKDLQVIRPPEETTTGVGRFHFSDRYSVFDWGEMPDQIPYKGESIAILGAYFFERLNELGIRNHYLGMIEDDRRKSYSELKRPTRIMEVQLLRVIRPSENGGIYDYSVFKNLKGNFLIPLEVIYRNSLPKGSSVFKRLRTGELSLKELGLEEMPEPGQRLPGPLLDLSTKLEITDRYLTWEEAKDIANLSEKEMFEIRSIVMKINRLITEEFNRIGLTNEDGKIELGFTPERELMVVDVLGTLDECRFTYRGIPVSKEIARIYYRKTSWYREIEGAKMLDRQNWKSLVKRSPEPLPPRLRELISLIYRACTNEVTGKEWFKNVPSLKELLEETMEYL
jgi:phosphoribosylaminoimidazole-succinocarboxamide synthase